MFSYLRRAAIVAGTLSPIALYAGIAHAAKPTAQDALSINPTQADIDCDIPAKEEIARCKVDNENVGGLSGYVVRGPSGEILRRYFDTNGDGQVDQWCYFKDGIEVYRDIDTDHNNKVDECRWLGTAGTRWGIDKDQDGKLDSWKTISAEEVTSELVAAIRDKDAPRFKRLLIASKELDTLGLNEKTLADLKTKVATAAETFAEQSQKQRIITAQSEWIHFGSSRPGIIPSGTDGSTKDLIVYDNITAVVETPAAKDKKHSQLYVGSLVKVGDGWRMIDLPKSLTGETTAGVGYFLQLAAKEGTTPVASATNPDDLSPEARRLYDELDKLDKSLAAATTPEKQAELNDQRATLLEKLIKAAASPEDRANWIRQYAETVSAAVTSGSFPEGIKRLETLLDDVATMPGSKELTPFVKYRLLQAQKDLDSQKTDADYAKINETWIAGLERIVSGYSASPEAAEAMLQLAMTYEFDEKPKDALVWYSRILKDSPKSDQAKKATGAKTRLESVGQKITLKAKSVDGRTTVNLADYSGKVVLIHYWATWADPSIEDMEIIKNMQAKYGKSGFQPLGVNLDTSPTEAVKFLAENRLPWPHAFEEGGIDNSRLASEMGILTLPMMILVDKQGRVLDNNVHAGELDGELKKALGLATSSTGSKAKTR